MDYLWLLLLLAVNAIGVLLVALTLPGTWLILLATGLYVWLREDGVPPFGWGVLVALLVLALLGEILEFLAGAMGVKSAGGSTRGAIGAIAGGLLGAIAGTIFIPVPIIGSIIGAAAGSFAGAFAGERSRGVDLETQLAAGKGAFWGRLLGTVAKLFIAAAMWIVVALAAFV